MQKYEIYIKVNVADNEVMKANDWENLRSNLNNYVKEYIRINRLTPGFMTTEFIENPVVESKIIYNK